MNGFDSPEFNQLEKAKEDATIRDIVRINESKLNGANQRIADLERLIIQKDAQLQILIRIVSERGI
jgi:hypothetical protein